MKLVDVDKLWEQMKELYEKRAEEANMTGDRVVCVTWHDAVIFIKNAPAIDAIPVVRCKDCRHWIKDEKICCGQTTIGEDESSVITGKNDFCSMGERW